MIVSMSWDKSENKDTLKQENKWRSEKKRKKTKKTKKSK